MTLEEQLHQEMLNLYSRAGKETGYWGNYYLRSVKKNGGLATARKMLVPKKNQKVDSGLQALIDAGRADELSVEAIALRHEFRLLFTNAEIAEATKRLEALPLNTIKTQVSPESIFPEVLPDSKTYAEGAVRSILVNAYERDPKARADCLAKYGKRCAVCTISFEEHYGEIGKGFIHVHHKKPLATIRSEYKINPKIDLIPVCPNCHAMLHSSNPPLSVATLKLIYESGCSKTKTK
jgi:5-methylcytosine-specific restriction protein A